jgi:hypothetical protein
MFVKMTSMDQENRAYRNRDLSCDATNLRDKKWSLESTVLAIGFTVLRLKIMTM